MEVYAWSVVMLDDVHDSLVCGASATKEEAVQMVFNMVWGLDDPETLAELVDAGDMEHIKEQMLLVTNAVGERMPLLIEGHIVSVYKDEI